MIKLTMPMTSESSVVVSGEFEEEAVEALVIAVGGSFGLMEASIDECLVTLSAYSGKPRPNGLPEAFMITIYDQLQKVLVRKQTYSQFS